MPIVGDILHVQQEGFELHIKKVTCFIQVYFACLVRILLGIENCLVTVKEGLQWLAGKETSRLGVFLPIGLSNIAEKLTYSTSY